jgi:hypothetical protein
MDEHQRVARAIEGRAAQRLTLDEAADLLEHEGRTGRDLRDGLEVAGAGVDEPRPIAPMAWASPRMPSSRASRQAWHPPPS